MSTAFVFGGTSLQDAENQAPRRGKNARENVARNNAPKRAALGVITNQLNVKPRVQPFRAAKGLQDGDENACRQVKNFEQQSGFSIFVDDQQKTLHELKPVPTVVSVNQKSKVLLTDAVTALPQRAIATANDSIICLDDSVDSPMVLDISHDIADEDKKPLDRESIITTVPEYAEEIYAHLQQAEIKNRPKPGYMKKQQDITNSMRSILVDWLVEVSEEYKLHRETLFLAVSYIDRFLSTMAVQRGKLQLVGAASMFLASKYEEIYPPDVGEFAYITDDTYTKTQVLRMEHLILKVLKFDVSSPTANWFCDHFLQESKSDDKTKSLAMFLAELTMIECDPFLKYLPSVIASAATCLARFTLGHEPWPECLVKTSGYEIGSFVACLRDLHKIYLNAPQTPQQAVMEKYKASKHHEVADFSKIPPPASLPLIG